jgi:hypothetical protein
MLSSNKAMSWNRDEPIIDSIWQNGEFTVWVQRFSKLPWVQTLVHRVRQVAVKVWVH